MSENDTPVVVTRDGWLLSSWDKVARKLNRGETTGPAYVLDVDYETADEETRQRVEQLAERIRLLQTDEEYRR